MDIFGYLQHNWPWIAGVGGAGTAIAVFVRECLTIAKLRSELSALKQKAQGDKKKSESVIKVPSDEEILRYSRHRSFRRSLRHRSRAEWGDGAHRSTLMPVIIMAGLVALGYLAWPFVWRFATGLLIAGIVYFFLEYFLSTRFTRNEANLHGLNEELRKYQNQSDSAA